MLPALQQSVEVCDRSDWKMRVLMTFLAEKGLAGLPGDPREMADYRAWLEQKGYKPNSVSACLSPVRDVYRTMGIETRKILKSPRRNFGYLKDPVSEQDTRILLQYVDENCGLRDRAIVYLLIYLGLRDIEVSRMDVGDFFMEDGRFWLRIWGKGRSCKDERKTVTNKLLEVFIEYRDVVLADRKVGSPMFLGNKKHRLRPDVLSRLVSGIMKAAGVKTPENDHRITPHSLRHTAITKVVREQGIRRAQRFARHLDVRTTEIYAHDVEDHPEADITW